MHEIPFPSAEWMEDGVVQAAQPYYPQGFLDQLSEHYHRPVTLGIPQRSTENHSSLVTLDLVVPVQTNDFAKRNALRTLGTYRLFTMTLSPWEETTPESISRKHPQTDLVLFSYQGTYPRSSETLELAATLYIVEKKHTWYLDEKKEFIFPGIKDQPLRLEASKEPEEFHPYAVASA